MKLMLSVVVALLVCSVRGDEDDKDSIGTVVGIDLGTTYSW